MSEMQKILAWSTILDRPTAFMKGEKPNYPLINKILSQYGYRATEKVFMMFVISNRYFNDDREFLAATFGELEKMSKIHEVKK